MARAAGRRSAPAAPHGMKCSGWGWGLSPLTHVLQTAVGTCIPGARHAHTRAGCTLVPRALTQTLTHTFTLRLQNRGLEMRLPPPQCVPETPVPISVPSQTPIKSKGPNTVLV